MTFYTRKEAKEQIDKILREGEPVQTGITLPIRSGQTFNVYQIPIEYLAPNILNDRISWRIREYEAENNRHLSNDNPQDIEFVYSLIEKESPNENNKTIKDLAEKGQQVIGIITKDGIIIDGNRRATLLRKLFQGEAGKYGKGVEDFRFFKAVVLTEDIDGKEIMALETRIQIGEDKKLDYNSICMYIKVDNLIKAGYNVKQIANYMGNKESDVQEKIEVFKLMNDYLDSIGKPNHFTLLDGLEDQFINTKSVFKKMDNGTYATDGWEYTDSDVANFKLVCYDYMRSKFEGKKYREVLVGKTNKTNGVFIKKQVWDNFLEHHNEIIEKNDPQNEEDWKRLGKKQFVQNLEDAAFKLKEVLKDKDVKSIISTMQLKLKQLENILSDINLDEDDYIDLKQIEKDIYRITKDFK